MFPEKDVNVFSERCTCFLLSYPSPLILHPFLFLSALLSHFPTFDLEVAEEEDDHERGGDDAEISRVGSSRTVPRPSDDAHHQQVKHQYQRGKIDSLHIVILCYVCIFWMQIYRFFPLIPSGI